MNKAMPRYQHIYNAIRDQIYDGKLKRGDHLPSNQALRNTYGAGDKTIRKALSKLSEDGLIETCSGRVATVRFDAQDPHTRIQLARATAARQGTILDAHKARCLLVPPIIRFGAAWCSAADIEQLRGLVREMARVRQAQGEFRNLANEFVKQITMKTYNRHLLYILERTNFYSLIPSLLYQDAGNPLYEICGKLFPLYEKLCDSVESKEYFLLEQQVRHIYELNKRAIDEFLYSLNRQYGRIEPEETGTNEHVDFIVDRLYILLASIIVEQILTLKYTKGDYLPSESELHEEFNVSVVTIRNAYKLLNELGIVKTINKKGTMVIMEENYASSSPAIKKFVTDRLDVYFEALQILSIISYDVSRYAAQFVQAKDIHALREDIEHPSNTGHRFSVLILWDGIFSHIPNQTLHEIIQTLKYELIIGTFLRSDRLPQSSNDGLHEKCRHIVELLEKGDIPSFAEEFSEIWRMVFDYSQDACEILGLPHNALKIPT